jgi:polyphosphate kinase
VRSLSRELSSIDFDRRLLELAADKSVPLLERVRLCGIVSSNLDDFFALRMGALHARGPAGRETIAEIRARVIDLQATQDELWLTDLQPALREDGIELGLIASSGGRDRRELARYFERWVGPLLTPIAVGAAAPFPQLRSLMLGLAVSARSPRAGRHRFVCVGIPLDLPRFVRSGCGYVALEDLILNHLDSLVGSGAVEAAVPFRITRGADAPELRLQWQRFGTIVRLELPAAPPSLLAEWLQHALGVAPVQTFESAAPLGLRAAVELVELARLQTR